MRLFRPRSFLVLILLAFGVVTLPLVLALVNAGVSMERLARQGTEAVYRSVWVTEGSRALVQEILALERKARQYDVLGKPSLLEEVEEIHREIGRTLVRLLGLPLQAEQKSRLESLQQGIDSVLLTLKDEPAGSMARKEALARFAELSALANRIYEEGSDLIMREVTAVQKGVESAQENLIWQAATLIPFSILFVALFTLLLFRPIRQIVRVIHRLGEGDLTTPAVIRGPQDLEYLGERLDWLRTQLAEVERAKSTFVARMSHELKTPLASIREGSELLADELTGPLNAQQQEVAGIVRKSSVQMQRLIDNLLGFSKTQTIISPMHYATVEFDQLVAEVLADYQLMIRKKEIHLIRNLTAAPLRGDRERLRTIVDNLISNALKYTPMNGSVTVRTGRNEDSALLEVIDNGPGISPDEREKVFEPFFQGKELPTPGHIKGTGLGLYIVREFVSRHGGTIQLMDSAAGSHFRVVLPLRETEDFP